MADEKFTPGPWACHDCETHHTVNYGSGLKKGGYTHRVCDTAQWSLSHLGPTLEQATANAHLIAAAPDMHEALSRISAKINTGDDSPNDYWTDLDGEDVELIFAALTKARGEA